MFFICKKITPHELFHPESYGDRYIESNHNHKLPHCELVIAVAAYNVNVGVLRKRIEYLVEGMGKWKIFIYGLDSTKIETLYNLIIWRSECPHVVLVPKLASVSSERTIRIAQIRNSILDAISDDDSVSDDATVLIYDGDHVGPMSKNGLVDAISTLERRDDLFAISASGTITIISGLDLMYDSFAFVGSEFPRFHSGISTYLEVKSAFSGACLYRWYELKQFRYPFNAKVCEHASLNPLMGITLNKKMVMSKQWRINVGFGQNSVA